MSKPPVRVALYALSLLAILLVVSPARPASGKGGPIVGPGAVVSPDGDLRYVVRPTRGHTSIKRVERTGGGVVRSTTVQGRFGIPFIGFDGFGDGLSADRGTLVLPQVPDRPARQKSTFAILDAERLGVREIVTFDGAPAFDAISPDGTSLYLIEYPSPRDPSSYAVRAYDVEAGLLLQEPVVDPSEPEEEMRGYPITRAMSPDGRWAYTLYGGGEHPFVHALDTVERTAVCIDLDMLTHRRDFFRFGVEMSPDGERLTIADGSEPVAFIDTSTFEVSEPGEPAESSDEGASTPLPSAPLRLAVVALLAALLAAGAVTLARRRRAGAP